MNCEMCGKDAELFLTKIEGTSLKTCERCARHGNIIKRLSPEIKKEATLVKFTRKPAEAIEEMISSDYAEKIKNAREKKGIKQEDFAKIINEKDSLIHKIETGHLEPDLKLARKLEHFLGIRIIEEVKLQGDLNTPKERKEDALTLGDIVKIKKR